MFYFGILTNHLMCHTQSGQRKTLRSPLPLCLLSDTLGREINHKTLVLSVVVRNMEEYK